MLNNYNFDDEIVRVVRELQRTYSRVFPWMVMPHLKLLRVEGSLRRDMRRLAESGRLIRVGGYSARQGYKVPNFIEPIALKKWGNSLIA